jgi:phosphoribosylformimino-5-aminoimidazole carboxamide ribonucleotide (ProFAR) isomerase
MDLYSRVNILGGLSVRLPHGGLDEAIPLDNDPIGRVGHWIEQGVNHVHVVDPWDSDKNPCLRTI